MDGRSQPEADSNVLSGIRFDSDGVRDGGKEYPCDGCRTLDCHSIHGPVRQECLLESCYICGDLERVDDEIANTYLRLSHLVRERQEIMAKPRHQSGISCIPVEILSMIFVFVKDALIDIELRLNSGNKSPYKQPSQSPPLLVGAVCRRWRDITLATPQLWTDIIIDLEKCADGQLNMVKIRSSRSGVAPLDIAIYLRDRGSGDFTEECFDKIGEVCAVLRSLAARWHDVALFSPASVCYCLLNNLQGTAPSINTLFTDLSTDDLKPIHLQHPLLPRRVICNPYPQSPPIPMEWNRLVFLETAEMDTGQILHILCNAQNLRHCISTGDDWESSDFPILNSLITNQSLIHLETSLRIIGHLTLPSLQHLDYITSDSEDLEQELNSIVEFMDRSRAPLDNFILRCYFNKRPANTPSFGRLPWITSLFLDFYGTWVPEGTATIDNIFLALTQPSPDSILPCLKEIDIKVFQLSALSWSLFSSMFRENPGSNNPDIGTILNPSIRLNRLLSQGCVCIFDWKTVTMDKDTFLCLLAAKKSGVDLSIVKSNGRDLFNHIAKFHE